MFFTFWEYLINFFEIILFYIFIDAKLSKTSRFRNIHFLKIMFLIIRLILICLMNYFQLNPWITLVFSYIAEIGFSLLFYDESFILCVFWSTLFSIICLIADYITLFIPSVILDNISAQELLQSGLHRITFTMLYITLIAVIVFLSQHMSEGTIHLAIQERIYYFTIAISGIAVGHYIMIVTLDAEQRFQDSSFTSKLILINLFFIVLFLSLILYIFKLGKTEATNIKLLEKEKQNELEAIEYKNLITTTESLREMKHDISIHLNVIQSMVENYNEKELLAYIADYTKNWEQTHRFISTGNTAIDCILSSKIDVAKKLDIAIDFSVIAPSNFPLDSISTSSLIGNMWNNAIDACQRLKLSSPDQDAYIHFYIKPYQDMVVIHMENNYDGYTKQSVTGQYLSTKTNSADHGLGLKRISDIVENADGILQIKSDENIFMIHIMIPEMEHPK